MTTLDTSAGSEKSLSFFYEISLAFSSMRADVSQETSFVVSACDERKRYINSVRALEILCAHLWNRYRLQRKSGISAQIFVRFAE